MKKRNLRIVALVLLVALIIPCYANAGDGEAKKDKVLTDEEMMELMNKQAPAMKAYNQLGDFWVKEYADADGMPEVFGGFYITDDFKLAIKVVNNDELFIEQAKKVVDDSSVLEFIETDVSFKELKVLCEKVWEVAPDMLVSSGINQKNSTVVVSVKATEQNNKNCAPALQALSAMELIEIVYEETETQLQTKYTPGSMIFKSSNSTSTYGGDGVLGLYGTYEFNDGVTRDCFVTAGHVERTYKREVKDMFFGQYRAFSRAKYPTGIANTQYCEVKCGDAIVDGEPSGSSTGDYAIMACNVPNTGVSTTEMTNKIQTNTGTVTVTSYCTSFNAIPLGAIIKKGRGVGNGSGSSSESYGIADTSNAIKSTGDLTIDGLWVIEPTNNTKYFSLPGDSGAPVYYMSGNEAVIIGIIHAGPVAIPGPGASSARSWITPMPVLVDHGFEPYVG